MITKSEIIERLRFFRKEIDAILSQLEAPAAPPPPPPSPPEWRPSPAPQGPEPGLLQNPYEGPVDRVTERETEIKNGPRAGSFGIIYNIHTPAATFSTFSDRAAQTAREAIRDKKDVKLQWRERPNGRYMNYDVERMRLLERSVARA